MLSSPQNLTLGNKPGLILPTRNNRKTNRINSVLFVIRSYLLSISFDKLSPSITGNFDRGPWRQYVVLV